MKKFLTSSLTCFSKFKLMALYAILFMAARLVAQPTTVPTAPTHAAENVISILSNTYTPAVSGIDFYPNWGQGTTFSEFPLAGNPIMKYATLDYQGIDLGANINISGMTTLHLDVWTDVVTTFDFYLVDNTNGPERAVRIITMTGWNSINIPLTDYTSQSGFSVSTIGQFKLQAVPFMYFAGTKTIYLYNTYFWKPAVLPVELVSLKAKANNNTTV